MIGLVEVRQLIRRHHDERTVDRPFQHVFNHAIVSEPMRYFAVSAVFHYLGPAFAVLLFARVDVLGVAWLRIAVAALIFAVWRRPWRRVGRIDATLAAS